MPDLIYNVKFEIDQASAEKVGNIVDTSNAQDIKVLQKEVERLSQTLKENAVENSKVKKSVKEKILAYKEEVASLKLLDSKINKSIQVYGEFSDETMSLVSDLRMQSEVVDNSGQELLEYANTTDRTTAEVVSLTNAVSTGNRAMVAGAKRSREMSRAQRAMGGQLGSTNKTFAAGNQAVFSFSDLIQDSTQFSYGFAQGMRAIGNNIGFTAELLAVMSAQAKESGQSLRGSLLASLKGVNGIVLGINVAVTIATVLLQKFGNSAKEASSSVDDFISSSAELRGVSDFDFLNIQSLERQQDALNLLIPDIEALDKATSGLQRNNTILGRSYGLAASSAIGANNALVDQQEISKELREEFKGLTDIELKDLIERTEELNQELILRRALFNRDPLAKFIDAQSKATQQTLLFVDAGLKSNEFLDKRREELEGLIQTEVDSGLATDESKAKYIELNKQLDAVNGAIRDYNSAVDEQVEKDRKLAEQKADLISQVDKQEAAIASLNASLLFGDATAKATELTLNHQISLSNLKIAYDNADESLKQFYQDLIKGEERLFELKGVDFIKQSLESIRPQGLTNQFEELRRASSDIGKSLEVSFEGGLISEDEFNNAQSRLKEFTATQETILVGQTVGAVAKAAGAFGELFGASKEFRIAMAVADGAAAVVSTLASVPFPASLAAAAGIATQVAQQIRQIKNTEIGNAGNVKQPSSSIGGAGSAVPVISSQATNIQQPTQQISFLPNAASSSQAPPTVDVKIDRAGLAVAVNKGNRELANKQVRV